MRKWHPHFTRAPLAPITALAQVKCREHAWPCQTRVISRSGKKSRRSVGNIRGTDLWHPSVKGERRKRCRAGEAVPDRRTALEARDGLRTLLLKKSDMQTRRGCRDLCSFIFWLAATEASTAASKGEHHPESSNTATSSPSCLLPSQPDLPQPLAALRTCHVAMIYMTSCSCGPLTADTLHANLAGLRTLRADRASRVHSGHVTREDSGEQRNSVDQQYRLARCVAKRTCTFERNQPITLSLVSLTAPFYAPFLTLARLRLTRYGLSR